MLSNQNVIKVLFTLICLSFAIPITPHIQGINVGGWMVIERFITPSLFEDGVNSLWDYVNLYRENNTMMDKLWNHWNTFVEEEDIRKLAQIGFTHIRLPVGYYSFISQEELDQREEKYVTGQLPLIIRSIAWMKKYNLKVILDLHSAPGSQNGWDNSGQYIPNGDLKFGRGDTINRTIDILVTISNLIIELENDNSTSDTVVGLELINEAFVPRIEGGISTIKDFYLRAYSAVRQILPLKYMIVIEMAFSPTDWINFMEPPEYQNVILDYHLYQCFDAAVRQFSYDQHLSITCREHADLLALQTLPTFVGEWSVAYKADSGWAHHEPYPNATEIGFIRRYALTQMSVFGSNFYWNFKTETAPMWDYFLGYVGNWLPHLPPNGIESMCDGFMNN